MKRGKSALLAIFKWYKNELINKTQIIKKCLQFMIPLCSTKKMFHFKPYNHMKGMLRFNRRRKNNNKKKNCLSQCRGDVTSYICWKPPTGSHQLSTKMYAIENFFLLSYDAVSPVSMAIIPSHDDQEKNMKKSVINMEKTHSSFLCNLCNELQSS